MCGRSRARGWRPHFARGLERRADERGPLHDDLGAVDGFADVGADVLTADVLDELLLQHELCGLLARAAEDEGAARSVDLVGEAFEGL
jgi:hypothetical protein